jgi:hypothetical protein
MKQSIFARWLLAIASTHLIFGLIIFYPAFIALIKAGWWNQIGPDNLLGAVAFWFVLFTWPLMMLVINMWSNPKLVDLKLLMLGLIGSLVGATANPVSGFWTLTILCLIALLMTKKQKLRKTLYETNG